MCLASYSYYKLTIPSQVEEDVASAATKACVVVEVRGTTDCVMVVDSPIIMVTTSSQRPNSGWLVCRNEEVRERAIYIDIDRKQGWWDTCKKQQKCLRTEDRRLTT